ncbi:MAG: HEAT repeat domain-containing protein [Anaerolineales bacterium]|nr:HEAT repeat domain-containing protein [Anaerolineales bacterium]
MPKHNKQIPFGDVLKALLDEDTPFSPTLTHRFSDLETEDMDHLKKVWGKVPVWRRQSLMVDIEELGERDFTLSFENFCLFALNDDDPKIREFAIRSLWDYDNRDAMRQFIDMLENDPVIEVKAAAALGLGKFVYLGEIEEIPEETFKEIEDLLLNTYNNSKSLIIRRRALEALGFSSRKEVAKHINTAINTDSVEWKSTALFAMGRSADERWIPQINAMLTNDNNEIRYQAARAAGELEAKVCTPELVNLLDDDDKEISLAAIWSLSQIGGEGIQEILEKYLEEAKTDDEAEFLESALDNLEFTNSTSLFSLLDYSAEGDDLDEWEDELFDFDEDDED